MKSRIAHPAFALPGAFDALQALVKATEAAGVPQSTLELVHLRASQINGCGMCLNMHADDVRKAGDDAAQAARLMTVAGWRDTAFFTDAERAALALTEAVTRLADRADPVPDEVWDEAAKHYDEAGLAALVLSIGTVNVWNRLNVAIRQVARSPGR